MGVDLEAEAEGGATNVEEEVDGVGEGDAYPLGG